MSKCIFGQYVLINNSKRKFDPQKTVFVTVNFYKDFNIDRTINHLEFAMKKLGCKIPYAVFHYDELKGIGSQKEFIKEINKQIKKNGTI